MDLIIETDIGRDADDFFAICYIASLSWTAAQRGDHNGGFRIRALTVTPGDPDQIAVAKCLLKRLNLENIPVGIPKERNKKSISGFHEEILKAFMEPSTAKPDGIGHEIIHDTLIKYPGAGLFCIGPVTNVGEYLRRHPQHGLTKVTMQGGFCSYDLHSPRKPLAKFASMQTCPTFNLNGDVEAGKLLIAAEGVHRQFVGKNVCHGVVWNRARHQEMHDTWEGNATNPVNTFIQASEIYLRKHPEKKFHDPTAAVCMAHPEVAEWMNGKLYREKGGWGTRKEDFGDAICVDLNEEKLWEHITMGT